MNFEKKSNTEGETGDFRTTHATTTAPQTAEDYEATWSAWLRAALPEEKEDCAIVVQRLRECQDRNDSSLNLNGLMFSFLPDLLPNFLTEIKICANPLYSPLSTLPTLPDSLTRLWIRNVALTSLP